MPFDYPHPELRIQSHFKGGYGAVTNITVGTASPKRSFLIHELSHGRYGGISGAPSYSAYWHESFASFTEIVAADDPAAHRRADLTVSAITDDKAILDVGFQDPWETQYAITYKKAALVLSGLTHLIGSQEILQLSERFVERYRGKEVPWEAFVHLLREERGGQPARSSWQARQGCSGIRGGRAPYAIQDGLQIRGYPQPRDGGPHAHRLAFDRGRALGDCGLQGQRRRRRP